jgi:iron-sulfur cluster repair protein YtfE (RIC family)
MAQANGPGPSVAEALRADDEWLIGLLRQAEGELAAGDVDAAEQDFAEVADRLERHMDVEERVLYPALDRVMGPPTAGGPTARLADEHEALRHGLDEVAERLAMRDPFAAAGLARLEARLVEHVRYEESLVYPTCDRELDAAVRVLAARELVQKGRGLG